MTLPILPAQPSTRFSIGAVVDAVRPAYPDVTHSSLRFLERRGLIAPHRSHGGHRLYSQGDVDRILQIKRWQAQRLTLDQIGDRLRRREHLPASSEIARHLTRLLLSGDLVAARAAVLGADDAGLSLADLFDHVISPALVEVGRHWQAGALLVAQEKEISEFTRDLIVTLTDRHRHPHPTGPTLLAASVEGEFHELGLRMVICMLRAEGSIVRYLGANVGATYLSEVLQVYRPAAVLLSARLTANLDALRASIEATQPALPPTAPPRVIVGGEIVLHHHELIRSWGAITLESADLDVTIADIRALVSANANAGPLVGSEGAVKRPPPPTTL